MKSILKKIFRFAIYAVIGIGLVRVSWVAFETEQNRNYAADVFSFMPFESVLESRKWLPSLDVGCTYAIVSLDEASHSFPPTEWLDPSYWIATPIRFRGEEETRSLGECRNLICECESEWKSETYQRITRALSEPGSFYYFHSGSTPPHDRIHQDVIHIYSPTERIAAKVRYGD